MNSLYIVWQYLYKKKSHKSKQGYQNICALLVSIRNKKCVEIHKQIQSLTTAISRNTSHIKL